MALTDYTTYDTIRGVVGVAETEIEDSTLALPLYASQVLYALEDLNATIPAMYATIKALAAEDRTAQQARFYELVGVYAAYWVAKVLLGGSIKLFAPKMITDSKATQQRVDDPFSDLRGDIDAALSIWAKRIGVSLALLDPSQSVAGVPARTYSLGVGIVSDPVTGV